MLSDRAAGSFEGRVLVSARKFKDLGAATGAEMEEIQIIEKQTRTLQQPDGSLSGSEAVELSETEAWLSDGIR